MLHAYEKREVIMRKLYAAILPQPFVWPYPVRLHGRLNISPR
ncbi:hypothetical protein ECDEC10A_1025 [Escherichia coli DEC10A]|nr:hypothetical protein ECDEC10A_1025 [Escherichia coli DEC10A]